MLALAFAAFTLVQDASWLWFEARQSERPTTLIVETTDGGVRRVVADADTVLIEYLADGVFGALPQLAIDALDRNRVLLHFAVDEGLQVERARLELHVRQGTLVPPGPMALTVHRVLSPWSEAATSWTSAPPYDGAPLASASIGPEEGPLAIDVTDALRAWTSDPSGWHGFLLRAPTAFPREPSKADVDRELAALCKHEPDLGAALSRARAERRPLLALLVAESGSSGWEEHDRLLTATLLADPRVRAALEGAVTARIAVSPNTVSHARANERYGADPLESLGLRIGDVGPPAWIAVDAKGKVVALASDLGVFDAEALSSAWKRRERPAGPLRDAWRAMRAGKREGVEAAFAALEDEPEAWYWAAALAVERGDAATARARLDALCERFPEDRWTPKARARRAFPAHFAMYEPLSAPSLAEKLAQRRERAVRQLSSFQRADGSFPQGLTEEAEFRFGVTALAALALLVHGDAEASARAIAWIERELADADPRAVNTFGASYWLDLQLERHARKLASRDDVARAIDLLARGQLENGSWSYSRAFGESWRGGSSGWPETDLGRAHSVNTAQALDALLRARAAGFEVDAGVVERGAGALLAMRAGPGRFTYTWPEPRNFEALRCNVAKAPLGESVLLRLGKAKAADLELALGTLRDGLADLRAPGKTGDSWLAPHALSAYFRGYAWYHGVRSAEFARPKLAEELRARIAAEIDASIEPDGTWIDTLNLGKAHGTAVALLALWACDRR